MATEYIYIYIYNSIFFCKYAKLIFAVKYTVLFSAYYTFQLSIYLPIYVFTKIKKLWSVSKKKFWKIDFCRIFFAPYNFCLTFIAWYASFGIKLSLLKSFLSFYAIWLLMQHMRGIYANFRFHPIFKFSSSFECNFSHYYFFPCIFFITLHGNKWA